MAGVLVRLSRDSRDVSYSRIPRIYSWEYVKGNDKDKRVTPYMGDTYFDLMERGLAND